MKIKPPQTAIVFTYQIFRCWLYLYFISQFVAVCDWYARLDCLLCLCLLLFCDFIQQNRVKILFILVCFHRISTMLLRAKMLYSQTSLHADDDRRWNNRSSALRHWPMNEWKHGEQNYNSFLCDKVGSYFDRFKITYRRQFHETMPWWRKKSTSENKREQNGAIKRRYHRENGRKIRLYRKFSSLTSCYYLYSGLCRIFNPKMVGGRIPPAPLRSYPQHPYGFSEITFFLQMLNDWNLVAFHNNLFHIFLQSFVAISVIELELKAIIWNYLTAFSK